MIFATTLSSSHLSGVLALRLMSQEELLWSVCLRHYHWWRCQC